LGYIGWIHGFREGQGRTRLCWVEEEGRDIMIWRGALLHMAEMREYPKRNIWSR
jgi:fido (protein-threonine AMPylation protein)